MVRKMTRTVILSCGERHSVSMVRKMTRTVILSRVDGEGSPNAKTSHFEILRRAAPTQDDGRVIRSRRTTRGVTTVILSWRTTRCVDGEKNDPTVILSRVDGEGSPDAKTWHSEILRRAAPTQDD